MIKRESKWLISVVMSIVMLVTLFAAPASAFAGKKELKAAGSVKYVNSDGEEIWAEEDDNGFVYTCVNSDGEMVSKLLGYRGTGTTMTVPEKLGDYPVVSFAVDPRWPVVDEVYDQITSITLPASIECAHPEFMEYFTGLKNVSVPSGNENYRSESGVLYENIGDGYKVAIYPFAKSDKSFAFPSYVTKMYGFFTGCPIESITLSKSMKPFYTDAFDELTELKEIKVESGNPYYDAKDGVLFEREEIFDDETGNSTYGASFYSLERYPINKAGTSYTLPAQCKYIAEDAFDGNEYLKTLVIPGAMDRIDFDTLTGAENLKNIVFNMKDAPEAEDYYRYVGIRELADEQEGGITINYDKSGKGWPAFINWLNGKDNNSWEEEPWLEFEEIPAGSNQVPVMGYSEYGDPYPVYSKTLNGTYTKTMPTAAGTYYVKLKVDETEYYTGLESEAFQFKVVNAGSIPADNYWITGPDLNEEYEYGDDIDITAVPLFGEVDKVEFQKKGSTTWSSKYPSKPGIYAFRLIVNGKTTYKGIEYISSDNDVWFTINEKEYDIYLYCGDIALGDTPKPTAEFDEDENYSGCKLKLSDLTYTYQKYDEDADDYVTVSSITECGEYRVVASASNDTQILMGRSYFDVLSKTDYAKRKIDYVDDPKYLSSYDKEDVDAALKAYNALTDAEKAELGEKYKEALDKAVLRMDSVVAIENLEEVLDDYNDAHADYEEALDAYNKAKAAADKAAKTPGPAAVKAAEKAKAAAEELAECAAEVEKLAAKVEKAAGPAAEKSQSDPALTRLQKQNYARFVDTAAKLNKDASSAVTAAASKVKAATSLVSSAQAKYGTAAKKYKVSGLKAKALKKKKAKITWKANKNATGYQIQYSLKKNMKKAKKLVIKKGTIKKATLKKLKAKKKYFVRIRTMVKYKDAKTGKTKTIYGKWSAKKTFKAKK